ncbi:hypothetical protein E2C01_000340 [Portunus trituberculatus]|uniref:Uncharacterized protein n=1 Tax=Portunus trituberculatus TaxID=210409 RepID=A0A5B7CJC8_PORTR|nr:hypothetical protein [Portunus trituberculatus]
MKPLNNKLYELLLINLFWSLSSSQRPLPFTIRCYDEVCKRFNYSAVELHEEGTRTEGQVLDSRTLSGTNLWE